jgi:hypothetical protein
MVPLMDKTDSAGSERVRNGTGKKLLKRKKSERDLDEVRGVCVRVHMPRFDLQLPIEKATRKLARKAKRVS